MEDLKCNFCGGSLALYEGDNTLKCTTCGKEFSSDNIIENNNISYCSCKKCNIDFQIDDFQNKKCIYCGEDLIPTNKFEFASEFIPFKISKEEALKQYTKFIKFNPFLALKFRNKKIIDNISGFYIPLSSFDFSVEGNVLFDVMDTKCWSDKNYKYKEITKYTDNFKATGSINKVYVSNINKISEDTLSYLEPYDFSELQNFSYDKKENYYIQNGNINLEITEEEAKKKITEEILKYMKSFINHQKKRVGSNSLNFKILNKSSIYIPLWILNVDGNFVFINGQSGKIFFNTEIKRFKIIMFASIVFILLFIIAFLIAYFV